jgi:Transient receptor potential (TRP) ion channel/ML-like domain
MRLFTAFSYLVAVVAFAPLATAVRLLKSTSLLECMADSNFTASLFEVTFFPGNRSLNIDINGMSDISGNVTAELKVTAYGFNFATVDLDPCKLNLEQLCPMQAGAIPLSTTVTVSQSVVDSIPNIAYTVPDLDGQVYVYINSTDTGERIACLEASLSNNQTVYQKAVEWVIAIIAGLGLMASAITSGLGHSNTAAHVAANALSLFGFFQAQAMIGETAVQMPPIVESWTQNFQWSMGLIQVGFLQTIATWYQRATGGTPSTLLSSLSTTSVNIQKRWLDAGAVLYRRSLDLFQKRASSDDTLTVTVTGLERVSFMASMEITNLFLTGLIWFVVFVSFVMIGVAAFKGICELLVKYNKMPSDKFQDFRNGWKIVMRGILFRLTLIGWAQMSTICFWELVERDSAAEVVLAVVMWLSMAVVLGWAAFKVITLARRSIAMHKNPAYILYSDPTCLNKWGFLYVQYRATAYYFVIPVLGYLLLKGLFIAFGQNAEVAQAVAFLIIEAAFLVAVSVIRPWMDKRTNIFNISIAACNFLNAVFLLVFSNVFNQPVSLANHFINVHAV